MKITNTIVWDHRGRTEKGGKGQLTTIVYEPLVEMV